MQSFLWNIIAVVTISFVRVPQGFEGDVRENLDENRKLGVRVIIVRLPSWGQRQLSSQKQVQHLNMILTRSKHC